MKKKYGVIVFDLGNTLIRFDHNIAARKIATLFRYDSKKIYDLFFDSEITREFEKGMISAREFYKSITHLLRIKIPYNDFVSIWNDIFWEDEKACRIARKLKKRYKLFLLSNINRLHFEHIREKFDIIKIFDELIPSFMIGAVKPDKRIFADMVKRSSGDKAQLLYIDDREDLIKEAIAFGIDSIRYEGADKLRKILEDKGVL